MCGGLELGSFAGPNAVYWPPTPAEELAAFSPINEVQRERTLLQKSIENGEGLSTRLCSAVTISKT